MDKLLKNKWFVRIISFLIAVLLYSAISAEQPTNSSGSHSGGKGGNGESKQLEDVKLVPYYDDNQYILSDAPDTVNIQLKSPDSSKMTIASLSKGHEAFIDLSGKQEGTYTVPVQTKGFPKKGMTVTPSPSEVTVTLHKVETKTFPVRIDLVNKDNIADGYQLEDPIISPKEVEITGAKETIDRIAFVEGFVDVDGAKDTVDDTVPLNIYDSKGNELDAKTQPSVVNVKVPITGQSKTVPVQADQKGSLPDGLSIESIQLKPDEVTLFGSKKVLDSLGYVKASLDLSKITKDTTIELKILTPDGVKKITPEKTEATVDVSKETTKTLEDIPIHVINNSDGLQVSLLDPGNQLVDVILKGANKALKDIKKSDINTYIDVKGLSKGKHSVKIEINGLQNNIKTEPGIKEAEIEITEENGGDTG